MDWIVSTEAATEPVTLDEAKLHLRVDGTDENALITEMIKSVRRFCEKFQNRAYITQSITARMDNFSNTIVLPMPRLIAVTTVKYLDDDGVQRTLANTYYDEDITSEPGEINLAYNQSWPTVRGVHHAIEIIYTAGYGAATTDVPEEVKSAMKLLLGHLYENREDVSEIKLNEVPMGVKSLLSLDRLVPV